MPAPDRERKLTCDGNARTSPVKAGAHELRLLAGMSVALEAMLDAIRSARERVWIETYIMRDDNLGTLLTDELVAAVRRGADVRLLYDSLGSEKTPPAFFDRVREAGVAVEAYRRLGLPLFPRDHSRIIVADHVAFTGGSAWGDEWLPRSDGGQGWHDVCVGIRGPSVDDLARIFLTRWQERESARERCPEPIVAAHPELTIVSEPGIGESRLLETYLERVEGARRRIWIENAYFLPPPSMIEALGRAARRGVDVRLILPCRTDLPSLLWAARGRCRDWMRRGIRVYQFTATVLHAKIAAIDDDWCTVGSFNLNPASIDCAHELAVFVSDRDFVRCVIEQLETDFARSVPLETGDLERWSWRWRLQHAIYSIACHVLRWFVEHRVPALLWSRSEPCGQARSAERGAATR